MANILIVYGTTEGHTAKIANFMKQELTKSGHQIKVIESSAITKNINLNQYDGVLVGASVHRSSYPTHLRNWVKSEAQSLSNRPSAFFSVCLGILEKSNLRTQDAERKVVKDFLTWTGWRPLSWAIFPGAPLYSKYGWFKRYIMRAIAKKAGGDADTSRDYEYTDWEEVRRFIQSFNKPLSHSWEPQLKAGEG